LTLCPFDCEFNYFDWDLREIYKHEKYKSNHLRGILKVDFKHNRLPNQLIESIPEITFISFVSNFGGLLGMWLGMSCVGVLEIIEIIYRNRIIRNIYEKANFNLYNTLNKINFNIYH